MNKNVIKLGILLSGLLFQFEVYAQTLLPGIIQGAINSKKYTLEAKFPAGQGLTGWALQSTTGLGKILYTLDDGKVVNGDLYDRDGTNLTAIHKSNYLKVKIEKSDNALEKLRAITEGSGAVNLYVFFDPFCGYCDSLYDGLREHLAQVTIHWIPVNFLQPEVGERVIHRILADDRPARALERFHRNLLTPTDGKIPASTSMMLDEHLAVMKSMGLSGTPSGIVALPGNEQRVFYSIDDLQGLL